MPSNYNPDALAVLEQLRSYSDRMTTIMDLIADKHSVTREEKEHLQELLTSLKSDLSADAKRGSTIRGEAELNDIERAYLYPAVFQASADILVATNSHPIKSNWLSEMAGVKIHIDHFLHELGGK